MLQTSNLGHQFTVPRAHDDIIVMGRNSGLLLDP